jgi:dipeptidyl aminopeptidase/acylaminoacyl peptidase
MYLPENFDRKRKYSMAFLIHGGPQGAWEDGWSTRWNPAVFANANLGEEQDDNGGENKDGMGWVVVAINPTGSTGYGQNFTDTIQGNWGTIPCTYPCPYH